MLIHKLRAFLKANNIPLQEWGKGSAKTLGHLLSELNAEESRLVPQPDGRLFRLTLGGMVNVYHQGETLLLLREDKQVYRDGRERKRRYGEASIGEKMREGEDPTEAAYRALAEELGIHEPLPLIPKPQIVIEPRLSGSFPGIWSSHTLYMHDAFLPAHLYRPDGYVERQADKTSYFVWTKCSDIKARA